MKFSLYGPMVDFNAFSHHIEFTYEFDQEIISFLLLKVISSNGKLVFIVNLLINISIFTTNQVIQTGSYESDFKEDSSKLKSWFLKRGYPEKNIETELKNVLGGNNKEVNYKKEKGIPFVATFYPKLKVLQKIFYKNLYLL